MTEILGADFAPRAHKNKEGDGLDFNYIHGKVASGLDAVVSAIRGEPPIVDGRMSPEEMEIRRQLDERAAKEGWSGEQYGQEADKAYRGR